MMKLAIRIVLVCLVLASSAWAQQIQVSTSYLYQGSNQVPGATDWFGANGGRADASFGNWHRLGLVAETAGARSSNLTTFTYLAGPRRSIALGGSEKHKASAFAQVLLGGVHASDGIFPSGSTTKSSADAFALSMGGGLDVGLNHVISLRLIQADYLYTHLPNSYDNYESNFRLGTGVVLHLH
jgi:hypothetical protein